MQRILAIAWLTWKAALRFRLFLVLAALLLAAVVGLPMIIQSDGTAKGFTQIILTYTLSAITGLLGLSTLWLACGTLARDIEECQMQVVATKPIARWQIWLGKWLGIVALNAALLAISGAGVYGLMLWQATRLPAAQQEILRDQVLVARGTARPPDPTAEIQAQTRKLVRERLKDHPELANSADLPEVEKQINEQVKAVYQVVPPGYTREWQVNLSAEKNSLKNRPLQLRIKFNAANGALVGTFTGLWMIGDPQKGGTWRSEPMSLSPDTFHEFQIPANLLDANGVLTVSFVNLNNTTLLFPLKGGMEVLYPVGGFALNFARGLGIILCWMALLAAVGLMAASFLSFPVAAFFSVAVLTVVFSSGMLAQTVAYGTFSLSGTAPTPGHSWMDIILIPLFRGIVDVVSLVREFTPIDSLSTGRAISWGELAAAFGQIVLLLGGLFAAVGIILFSRRELATAQGNQ